MSNSEVEDILRPLSDSEAQQMVEICAQNLPLNLRGYGFLRQHLLWTSRLRANPELSAQCQSDHMRRKIYTKRNGQLENCTFISIAGPADYNIFIYSNDPDELRECLMRTNLIEWNRGPFLTSFEGRHRRNLTEVFEARGIEIALEIENTGNYVTREQALSYDLDMPDDVVVEPLTQADVTLVDTLWRHKYNGSLEYIKSLAAVNDALGIFSKGERELRAWVLVTEQFTPGILHTVAEHRGKGYAKLIVKCVAKLLAEKYDIDCYVFIMRENAASESLFRQSLGFTQIPMPNNFSWIWIKPQINDV